MRPAIEVTELSKVYNIGHEQRPALGTQTVRDAFTQIVRKPIELFTGHRLEREKFWALKSVSFTAKSGDVVGIIGRNGSGKSTLLKILSQIVDPTSGQAIMRGKVASLLEVGTGFHPELTGRENIFFNGAILGMSQKEIRSKFKEIVEFSEVEQFLDTPVKFYSSGMYVRLAFAVAAHLDPDVLIVDEVLAVGDAAFQKKCLGKMERVAKDGRTVLFVSHNMNAIEQLCSSAIYLVKGELYRQGGDVGKITQEYLFGGDNSNTSPIWENDGSLVVKTITPLAMRIITPNGKLSNGVITLNSEIVLEIEIEINSLSEDLQIGYALYSEEGNMLYWSFQTDLEVTKWPKLKKGKNILHTSIPPQYLNEGVYRLELLAALYNREWLLAPGESQAFVTIIVQGGLELSPYWSVRRPGLLAPAFIWETKG